MKRNPATEYMEKSERQLKDTKGPLESLKLKDHCEMCGANYKSSDHANGRSLEAAFNPSGKPMTLCRDCRIGSAELLADQRKELLEVLKQLLGDLRQKFPGIETPVETAAGLKGTYLCAEALIAKVKAA